ncbi:AzlC family ABC transporter permease [Thalassobaculum sp.]|uniref:AzlC family ABC transporter permease n=1 Tax=Thalassobaculum sp. TaxID=2022740 RepID=UPI0032EF85A0
MTDVPAEAPASPQSDAPQPGAKFTWDGFVRGFRMATPLALSGVLFGMAFGVLAREAGLSLGETLLMSMTVFAGASQMAALDLWSAAPSILVLAIATFAINVRHVVMGAALRPWFSKLPSPIAHLSLWFMTDANWAMSMSEHRKGERDAAILVGSGVVMWFGWVIGGAIGHLAGAALGDPRVYGADVVVPAFFALMLTPLWPGWSRSWPWAVAAGVAVASHMVLPGYWHVVAGGLAGSLAGAFADARRQ